MLDWFRKNKYPDFWKAYLALFKTKMPKTFEEANFVIFDTETTGLDTQEDRILCIGAVKLKNNEIDIAEIFELYLIQDKFNEASVEIHGILKDGKLQKVTEEEAIESFINYIGNGILVAHHTAFDVEMINIALKRIGLGKLKNKSIDTGVFYKKLKNVANKHYSLDALCAEFNISKHDRHTASGDAYITALLFLKILSKLRTERTVHFDDLFINRSENSALF